MALGDKRIALLEKEIELLRENKQDLLKQIEFLHAQVTSLQECLVAKESPLAYADQKAQEAESKILPEERVDKKRMHEMALMNAKLLAETEGPLFKDAPDMISILTKGIGIGDPEPMHDNDES